MPPREIPAGELFSPDHNPDPWEEPYDKWIHVRVDMTTEPIMFIQNGVVLRDESTELEDEFFNRS